MSKKWVFGKKLWNSMGQKTGLKKAWKWCNILYQKSQNVPHGGRECGTPPQPDSTPPTQEGVDILHNNIKKYHY